MAPFALVPNLGISSKLGHHMAPLTLVALVSLGALLALSVSIEFVSSSATVTSVTFQQGGSVSLRQPDP